MVGIWQNKKQEMLQFFRDKKRLEFLYLAMMGVPVVFVALMVGSFLTGGLPAVQKECVDSLMLSFLYGPIAAAVSRYMNVTK